MALNLDSLWPHQTEALVMCREYIDAYNRGATDGSALVRMPTGAGKSGVIAVLAAECLEATSCLIVTPWAALRDQIGRDVKHRFWTHADMTPPDLRVESFKPTTLETTLADKTPAAMTCTHATLQALHRDAPDLFLRLSARLGLLLVDEGHREPAPSWALAVRSLRKPCVLFSATPYRNDQKLFKVDSGFVSILRFGEAVEQGFVRSVDFSDDVPPSDPGAFIAALTSMVTGLGEPAPRVIVRCNNAAEIADLAHRLVAVGATAIGVHERFTSDTASYLQRKVPDPELTESQYWIHQFKLIEGIDDPRFRVLAIFSPLGDARALVQQVGRVIRNPSREAEASAIVFADASQRQHWEGYTAFEDIPEEEGGLGSVVLTLQKYLEAQAGLAYYGGRFRTSFDPKIDEVENELTFRLGVNILDLDSNVQLDALTDSVEDEFHTVDRHVLSRRSIDASTMLLVWLMVQNSPILRSKLFFEYRLGYTVLHASGGRVFVSDSDGRVPEAVRSAGQPVPAATLEGLFPPGSRLGAVSLVNTDLGPNSIRRRTLHARSISDTAPNLFDHAFFPSTAWGFAATDEVGSRSSRYVGFSRSRISDGGPEDVKLRELLEWMRDLAATLSHSGDLESSDAFFRYAAQTGTPDGPDPINILLDLGEIQAALVPLGGGATAPELDDLCYDVDNGCFEVRLDGATVAATVRLNAEQPRYEIESPELDRRLGVSLAGGKKPTEVLTTYLNREQAFRIVTADRSAIYAHSRFYKPRVPLGGASANRIDLLRVFHPIAALRTMTSEKGEESLPDDAGWQEDSIFGLVDGLGADTALGTFMRDADVLVCDDMQSEVADFFLGDLRASRVALVHAKAGSGQKRSATIFQEIAAQALKNLEFLSPYLDRKPPNYSRWGEPWRANGMEVRKRVRLGGTRSQAWRQLSRLIRDPSAAREVWLVLGAGFSSGDFARRVGRRAQPPEDIQILYLLSSLWSGVAAVGARLRIFCSP